jgi:hypothetical protein
MDNDERQKLLQLIGEKQGGAYSSISFQHDLLDKLMSIEEEEEEEHLNSLPTSILKALEASTFDKISIKILDNRPEVPADMARKRKRETLDPTKVTIVQTDGDEEEDGTKSILYPYFRQFLSNLPANLLELELSISRDEALEVFPDKPLEGANLERISIDDGRYGGGYHFRHSAQFLLACCQRIPHVSLRNVQTNLTDGDHASRFFPIIKDSLIQTLSITTSIYCGSPSFLKKSPPVRSTLIHPESTFPRLTKLTVAIHHMDAFRLDDFWKQWFEKCQTTIQEIVFLMKLKSHSKGFVPLCEQIVHDDYQLQALETLRIQCGDGTTSNGGTRSKPPGVTGSKILEGIEILQACDAVRQKLTTIEVDAPSFDGISIVSKGDSRRGMSKFQQVSVESEYRRQYTSRELKMWHKNN